MNEINTNYTIYLKVLTPVHIGGAQEKHLQNGLDFLLVKNKTWKINWENVYLTFEPDEVADAIISKRLDKLLENDIEDVAYETDDILSSTGEVKAFIRDGFGKAYIPGSSIKGAMKNWLYSAYDTNPRGTRNLFGNFDSDLFRFIKSGDCYMTEEVVLYPTKTFNLHKNKGKWEGGWKHKSQSFNNEPATNSYFKDIGFVTDYECFEVGDLGSFKLIIQNLSNSFKTKLYDDEIKKLEQKKSKIIKDFDKKKLDLQIDVITNGKNSLERFQTNTSIKGLFKEINSRIQKHIEREIVFFQNYTEAEYTQEIIDSFKNLKKDVTNLNENQCMLRLSSGSGFHGITGDYQFEDHVETGFWNNGKIKYKSRKIAFSSDQMYPMGFVLLSTIPIEKSEISISLEKKNQIQLKKTSEEKHPLQLETDVEMVDATDLKQGDIINAEITDKDKPYSKVKLMLSNYHFDLITDLSGLKNVYNTISIGQIVKCQINSFTKEGKIALVKYIE